MKYPEYLKKGDKIILTALSSGVGKKDLDRKARYLKAIDNLEKEGFKVEMQKHCLKQRMYKSASAKVRGHQFNKAYFDENCRMIINIAGGDFQYETMPYINYKKIKESPARWVQGYSDTTHITFLLPTLCDTASVYSNGLGEFSTHTLSESAANNLSLLKGEKFIQHSFECYGEEKNEDDLYALPKYTIPVEWKALRGEKEIEIKGRLIGGCQDVINSIVGTKYDKIKKFLHKYKDDGFIWFLETFSMDSGRFMMSLNQLREAGYFKYCKGIVFGRPLFYNMDWINISYEKAIKKVLGNLNIPIIYDADIGHVKPMITLVVGSVTTFKYKDGKCEIITELR
jgi:muramoyltetrapeptide carboxypeptidase LdcA involved in peptidoglycan recycling